jgi:hypothetical protein
MRERMCKRCGKRFTLGRKQSYKIVTCQVCLDKQARFKAAAEQDRKVTPPTNRPIGLPADSVTTTPQKGSPHLLKNGRPAR